RQTLQQPVRDGAVSCAVYWPPERLERFCDRERWERNARFWLSFPSFFSFHALWAGLSPLRRFAPAPLALSRFLRRGAVPACKNRSAAPLTAPCFVHWTRSLFVPPQGEPSVRASNPANGVVRR